MLGVGTRGQESGSMLGFCLDFFLTVNLCCLLRCARGYPAIWINIIQGVSVRVTLDDMCLQIALYPCWCSGDCVCVCSVVSDARPHGPWPTRLLCPRNSPCKNAGLGCHFLFQGIFPTQGSNPHLCVSCTGRQILYHSATWVWRIKNHASKELMLCFPFKVCD